MILAIALAIGLLVPFVLVGERLESVLGGTASVAWLERHGDWAWLIGLGLLTADILVPIPASAVMAALGILYGPLLGGALAAIGNFAAGSIAYLACRAFGQPAARLILGERDLARGRRWLARAGGWLVASSRALPLLPELVACLAGLLAMPARQYFGALLCGSLPVGFGFALLGDLGRDRPVLALALGVALPVLLWLAVRRHLGGSGAADPTLPDERQAEAGDRHQRRHRRAHGSDQRGIEERDARDQRDDGPGHPPPGAGAQP